MNITRSLAAEIKRSIEDKLGYRVKCELGIRCEPNEVNMAANALCWSDDHDLFECVPLHRAGHIDIVPVDGVVELDIYVRSLDSVFNEWEPDQNITAIVKDGTLIELLTTYEEMERNGEAA